MKPELRLHCWEAIRAAGAARFPGVRGRIPNFVGAEAAAVRLQELDCWRQARTLKCNPDSPQRPVRVAALRAGKLLYVPAPRLADSHPFLELDPDVLGPKDLWRASSIKGAFELGRPVTLEEMPRLDLIVTGCVGVTRAGARLGKGGGYSDLEYGLLRELGRVDEDTPIVTTVHPSQVLEDGSIPVEPHDISLDGFATPDEIVECSRPFPRPSGILWDRLDDERLAAIPVLAARRPRR
jgi:5-formyltetrahydrofolate cyclo-ligase